VGVELSTDWACVSLGRAVIRRVGEGGKGILAGERCLPQEAGGREVVVCVFGWRSFHGAGPLGVSVDDTR
jgi:hypothetical protein